MDENVRVNLACLSYGPTYDIFLTGRHCAVYEIESGINKMLSYRRETALQGAL